MGTHKNHFEIGLQICFTRFPRNNVFFNVF